MASVYHEIHFRPVLESLFNRLMNELIVINLDKNHLELHFKREVEADLM